MIVRLLLAFLIFSSPLLRAEEEKSKWFYRAWQTEDGLPDNSVSTIVQSPDGYLWIGTNGGVIRFNGNKFQPLPLRDNPALPSQQIHTMAIDHKGRLWLSMERGPLVRIEKQSHSLFNASEKLRNKRIEEIVEDSQGQIWLRYSGGIDRIKNGKTTNFGNEKKIPLSEYRSIACDTDGQVWLSSGNKIGRLDDDGFHFVQKFNSPIVKIAPSRQLGLWLIRDASLYHFQAEIAPNHIIDLPEKAVVKTLLEDRKGAIWIGTKNHGLFRIFEKHLEKIPTSHPWITCIHEDHEGHLWAGTKGGGLNLILPRAARLIDPSAGLPFSSVRSTSTDSLGRIWATSLNGLLAYQESGEWHLFTDLPKGVLAQCLIADYSGTVWLGTKKQGIFKIRDKQISPLMSFSAGFVRSLLKTQSGDLLISTSQPHQFHRIRNGELLTFEKPIKFGAIRALTESPDGTIWIGCSDGHLLRVEGDILVDESAVDGPENFSIRTLHSTPDGSLWIGYAGDGLGHLKDGKYRKFSKSQGLHDDYISQIQHDDHDHLWIVANRGLFKLSLSNLLSGSNHVYSQFFGRNNALPSIQPSRDFAPSSSRQANGQLYFSTHQGLLEVTPDDPQIVTQPPPVILEKVTLGNQSIALFKNRSMFNGSSKVVDLSDPDPLLTIPPDHNNLTISFAALNFTEPDNTQIRYRLHPIDEKWQRVQNKNSVTFPRLPAGKYKFQIIASSSSGVWSKGGATVDLIVKPFYWETWWFKLSLGLVTALIAGGFVFLSLRRKHHLQLQKSAAREALEQERSRIARDIHDDLGATLTRITLLSQSPPETADEPTRSSFHKIRSTARELMSSMDGVVWAISPEHDTFDDLANYLSSYAQEFLNVAGISCRLTFPLELPERSLSAQLRHNLLLAFKEALNNIVKYADASEVRVSLEPQPHSFMLKIEDNGGGLDSEAPASPNRVHAGNGMANMEERMTEIGANAFSKALPNTERPWNLKSPSLLRPEKASMSLEQVTCLQHEYAIQPLLTVTNPAQNISVSIIEDDLDLRDIYASWIEQADGFELVSVYDDGQKAFDGIPEDQPDVVLSDINLPGLNGVECVRGLKKQFPKIQFVMITVYEDSNRIFKALEAGATGYLMKQTPCEQLLESIIEVYQGGSPMSSGIARKVVQCFRKKPPTTEDNELSQLSKREEEVLNLLSQGYLCKEISSQLGISTHTVDTYRRRIYEKLHVRSRAQATAIYNQLKPVSLQETKEA